MEELLEEYTLSYPVSLSIKQQPGNRKRLTILTFENQKVNEQVFNFYDRERIYTYADEKTISIGIAKSEQNPATIRTKLKQMAADFKKGWMNAKSGK